MLKEFWMPSMQFLTIYLLAVFKLTIGKIYAVFLTKSLNFFYPDPGKSKANLGRWRITKRFVRLSRTFSFSPFPLSFPSTQFVLLLSLSLSLPLSLSSWRPVWLTRNWSNPNLYVWIILNLLFPKTEGFLLAIVYYRPSDPN